MNTQNNPRDNLMAVSKDFQIYLLGSHKTQHNHRYGVKSVTFSQCRFIYIYIFFVFFFANMYTELWTILNACMIVYTQVLVGIRNVKNRINYIFDFQNKQKF